MKTASSSRRSKTRLGECVFADVFPGLGSMRIAFEEFGAQCIWAHHGDPASAQCYGENFDPLVEKTVPPHDILLANLDACPAKRSRSGPTPQAFDTILDILMTRQPTAFLLASAAEPEDQQADEMIRSLGDLGYFVHSGTLDARRFALPQRRFTRFLVGFNRETPFRFPKGGGNKVKVERLFEPQIAKRYYLSDAERHKSVARRVRSGANGKEWRFEFVADGCANALSAEPDGPFKNIVIDGEQGRWRFLTEREAARLQGIPDCIILPGDRREAYRQVARSIPVPCAMAVAEQMIAVLAPGLAKRNGSKGKKAAAGGIRFLPDRMHGANGNAQPARNGSRRSTAMESEITTSGKCKSPLRWYGGLRHYASAIIRHLPPHDCYVEPCGGGASVLLQKTPSNVEVYNDRDGNLVNFWRVLREPRQRRRLIELVEFTPYSRGEYGECIDALAKWNGKDPVKRAMAFLITCNQGRNGLATHESVWSYSKAGKSPARGWARLPPRLAETGMRLKGVQVEKLDVADALRRYDGKGTLFLIDPPFVAESRVSPVVYKHEFSRDDHIRLLRMSRNLKGKVIICGYANDLYDDLLDGWARVGLRGKSFASPRNGGKLPDRTLYLWMNYDPPKPRAQR